MRARAVLFLVRQSRGYTNTFRIKTSDDSNSKMISAATTCAASDYELGGSDCGDVVKKALYAGETVDGKKLGDILNENIRNKTAQNWSMFITLEIPIRTLTFPASMLLDWDLGFRDMPNIEFMQYRNSFYKYEYKTSKKVVDLLPSNIVFPKFNYNRSTNEDSN